MVIPGNDDAIRSIRLITKIIADSCARGLESSKGFMPKSDSEAPVIQTIKKEEPLEAKKSDTEESSTNDVKLETAEEENQTEQTDSIEEDVADEEQTDNDESKEEEK
jgi:small subunit ribosomal protein S2